MTFFPVDIWIVIGLAGQLLFFARFIVQWVHSERQGESVIPVHFWYWSIGGAIILLAYALHRRDIVFSIGQGLALLIYVRNLMLIHKKRV